MALWYNAFVRHLQRAESMFTFMLFLPLKLFCYHFSAVFLILSLGYPSLVFADTTGSGDSAAGLTFWNANCVSCHGSPLGANGTVDTIRLNAANAGDVIRRAFERGFMSAGGINDTNFNTAGNVTATNNVAAWIATKLPAIATQNASYITPLTITIPNITLGAGDGVSEVLSSMQVVSSPTKGSLSGFSGTNITYTPSSGQVGTDTFTVRANGGGGATSNVRTVTVSIATPAPASGFSLSNSTGTGGSAFSSQVLVGGLNATGAGITNYTLASGSLPPGVNLNSSTGLISGTPTESGTFNFTVSATKNAGNTGTSGPLSIVVNQTTPVINAAPPSGTKDVPYSFTATSRFCGVTATTPTSCTWSFVGTPPAGLSITTSGTGGVNGVITGTPTGFGTFTIQVQNSVGADTESFVIANAPPVFSTTSLPSGNTGVAYTTTVVASNAPTYTITSGALPAGLSLNSTTGVISGTPSPSSNGTFNFTVTASNGVLPNATLATSITIALSSPLITSPTMAPPPGGVPPVIEGQPFTTYQITSASAISSFSCPNCATNLPSGLSFNSTTGQITGTPAVGTARAMPYNVTLQATNATATASSPLAITVSFAKPVTSDRTGFTVPANAATPIDLTSSITGTSALVTIVTPPDASAGTVTVSGNVVTFTPATDFLGAVSFTYKATAPSPGGETSDTPPFSTVSFNVVPVPLTVSNATLNVPLNTTTSLDLSSFISGTGLTGVAIVTSPSHGAVTVNGKVVTYVPVHDYFGADSFTYQAFGSAGTSQTATVTINIIGRPDPRQNANVMGILKSQNDAAKRFARAQVTNFQQRTESLHGRRASSANTASSGGALAGFDRQLTPALDPAAKISAISQQLAQQDQAREQGVSDQKTAPVILAYQEQANKESDAAADAQGQKLAALGNTLLSVLSSKSINLAGLSTTVGGEAANSADALEVWVMGNIRFGARENDDGAVLSTFRTNGVTIGIDKRFSENLVVGAGFGYAHEKTDISDDGSESVARGVSAAVYASYMPTDKIFVDGLLGYGVTDFDSDRYVAPADDFAKMHRKGEQYFGSLTAGYEYRNNGMLFSPYARFNLEYNRLDSGTENGAGLNALHFSEQNSRTAQLSLGFRAEATHEIDGGLAIPHARIELQGNLDKDGSSNIRYADQLNSTGFNLSSNNNSSHGVLLGFGNDFILNNGVKLGFEYQTLRGEGDDNSQSINFRVTKELGGPDYQPQIDNAEVTMSKLGIRIDAGYTYDDNVSRSELATDQEQDSIYSIKLSKLFNIPIKEHTRIVLNGFIGGERFDHFRGLENISAGVQGEFQYRPSAEFSAPTLGVFAKAAIEEFESRMRDGSRYSVGVSVRKPWTDRINLFGALSYNIRDTKSEVFDTKDTSARFNIDYMVTKKSSLYAGVEYRFGDTLSAGSPSLKNADTADVLEQDDVFTNRQLTQYRFDGKTYLGTLGYNLPLGPKDSLDFSWRYIRSSPDDEPSYVNGTTRYIVNQYSLVYLVRF